MASRRPRSRLGGRGRLTLVAGGPTPPPAVVDSLSSCARPTSAPCWRVVTASHSSRGNNSSHACGPARCLFSAVKLKNDDDAAPVGTDEYRLTPCPISQTRRTRRSSRPVYIFNTPGSPPSRQHRGCVCCVWSAFKMADMDIVTSVRRLFPEVTAAVEQYQKAKPDREARNLARRLGNEEALYDQFIRQLSLLSPAPSTKNTDEPLHNVESRLGVETAGRLRTDLLQMADFLHDLKADLSNTSRGTVCTGAISSMHRQLTISLSGRVGETSTEDGSILGSTPHAPPRETPRRAFHGKQASDSLPLICPDPSSTCEGFLDITGFQTVPPTEWIQAGQQHPGHVSKAPSLRMRRTSSQNPHTQHLAVWKL